MREHYAPFEKWWIKHYKKMDKKLLWKWDGGYQPVTVQFLVACFCMLGYVFDKMTNANAFTCEWMIMLAGVAVGQMWVWYCCKTHHNIKWFKEISDQALRETLAVKVSLSEETQRR
jgi:hypothetical protein